MKRLYRSESNKVFGGVLGGLGEYFGVDPVILRLGYVLITIFTGVAPGIIVYLIALLIVPAKPLRGRKKNEE
jgi:phage shock protein C